MKRDRLRSTGAVLAIVLGASPSLTTANDREFIHPGLLHSAADLDRIRSGVAARHRVLFDAFAKFSKDGPSQASYRLRGPFPEWGRKPDIRVGEAESDATAAYQNALMWAVTGDRAHAQKSIEIVNAWVSTLKRVSGIDGVLASGLQGFKFANAAELLRHTDSGWTADEAKRCERWFLEVWHPTIEHYAYFANGNWEGAALQTKMAIAVFCNDHRLFEEAVRYAVSGAGNGSISHTVVYPSGQAQETTRKQGYAQLGLGLLSSAAEVAWNQGVDLYGWDDNRILKGFEYTAKYGLGHEVPYRHYLDRTGKYGFGGRHNHYDKISTDGRGRFRPIFEQPFHHYAHRRGLEAPYTGAVAAKLRPEGRSRDHSSHGTLAHFRERVSPSSPTQPPGRPAGIVARTTAKGILLTWVRSVDPASCTDARSYSLKRADRRDGPFTTIVSETTETQYMDEDVERGRLYYYVVAARNEAGDRGASAVVPASAGLPGEWKSRDVGAVGVPGYARYDGRVVSLEGEGRSIGGAEDQFHFAYASMTGDGEISARVVPPMSSQWSTPGVMMRESLAANSPQVSVLLLPHWNGALVYRSKTGGETTTAGRTSIDEPFVVNKNRLMKPYWVRLVRVGNVFTGSISSDGREWTPLATAEVDMSETIHVGLPACSQLENVTTTVTYDRVSVPGWRMPE